MSTYYNDNDPFAAEWLRSLIREGLISDGVVDNRSITEVSPSDLKDFTRCHFFAGIGGWDYALNLSNWDKDRVVWTGSCPCQPFSQVGNRKGEEDERHLWPVWYNLIRECRPSTVFGEQVDAALRQGWWDGVQADMEREGYSCGMAVLPANSVKAPHKRKRCFFVCDGGWQEVMFTGDCDPDGDGWCRIRDCDTSECNCIGPTQYGVEYREQGGILFGRVGYTECERLEGHGRTVNEKREGEDPHRSSTEASLSTHWDQCFYPRFRDGKCRPIPIQSSLFPLVNGVSRRMGLLRGAGNAIVPQVAAAFINAYIETKQEI